MAFDGYLSFGGIELINALRTTEYVNHLIPQLGLVRKTDIYDTIADALGDEPYRTPYLDGADWIEPFDPTDTDVPRNVSHRFLGLYPLSIEGLGNSTMTATVVESILDGGYANAQRDSTRAVRVHGLLLAEDQLAAEAGLSWLRNALRSNGCGMHGDLCGFSDLRYFLAPPDVCNPRWTTDYHAGYTDTNFGTLTPDTSPIVQTIAYGDTPDKSGMPLGTQWNLPLTDGVIVRWGALGFSSPDVLEEYGPIYLRRSNFILNPSFTVDNSNWTASSGTITRVAPGYGHADQTTPVTYRNNWVPDPSFENGDPNLTGWRASDDIVQTTDGTAPQGTKVAVVAPTVGAGATWMETTMLGPFDDGVLGSVSFWTHNADATTITVTDATGVQVYSSTISGIPGGWQSVGKEGEIPMKQGYVFRIATAGAHELRVDGFLLEDSPTNLTFFDGDTAAGGGTVYYYVGSSFTGASRAAHGTYTSFSVTAAETDAPFGPAVLQFKMRATEATPTVLVELLDHTDNVVGSVTVSPTTAWTRYALGVGYGRNIRPRFTSGTGSFDIDQVMLEAGGTLNDYFDGHSTAPADYNLYWTASPDGSISRMDWTGNTRIDHHFNYRPFLYVDQGSLSGITMEVQYGVPIQMQFQLEAYDRTLHQVTCTTGVSVIRNYDLENGAAIEVDFTLTAGVPFPFTTTAHEIFFDHSTTGIYIEDDATNLVPYPSFELASGTQVVRTNLCLNPSAETLTTNWAGIAGTTGVMAALTNPVVANSTFSTHVIHGQWTTATTAAGGGLSTDVTVTAGLPYSFSIGHVLASIVTRLQFQIEWRTASTSISTVTTAANVVTVANTAIENNAAFTYANLVAPATATVARIKVISVTGTSFANWSIGSFLELDGVMANFGETVATYFDGSTANTTDFTYAWTGTVGGSTSTRSAPIAVSAVPSNTSGGATFVCHQVATHSYVGSHSDRTFFAVGPNVDTQAFVFGTVSATIIYAGQVVAGQPYTASAYVYSTRATAFHARISWMNEAATTLLTTDGVDIPVAANTWTRVTASAVAPAGATRGRVVAVSSVTGVTGYSRFLGGDYVDVDAEMLTYGTSAIGYFDGDTVDTVAYTYAWTGVTGASASTKSITVVTPANSLIDPDLPALATPPTPPPIPDLAITDQNDWVRYFVDIPTGDVALWAETIPTLELQTVTDDIRQLRVRFYPNPFGRSTSALDVTDYCGEFLLSYLPGNSTLTVNGVSQTAYAQVAGGAPLPANQLLYGATGTPVNWPSLSCGIPYVMSVDILPTTNLSNLVIHLFLNNRE